MLSDRSVSSCSVPVIKCNNVQAKLFKYIMMGILYIFCYRTKISSFVLSFVLIVWIYSLWYSSACYSQCCHLMQVVFNVSYAHILETCPAVELNLSLQSAGKSIGNLLHHLFRALFNQFSIHVCLKNVTITYSYHNTWSFLHCSQWSFKLNGYFRNNCSGNSSEFILFLFIFIIIVVLFIVQFVRYFKVCTVLMWFKLLTTMYVENRPKWLNYV